MSVTGVSEEEYKEYLNSGGQLVFEIDVKDIDSTGGFEQCPLLKPYLYTGFEIKPSPIVEAPENKAALFLYGGSWDRVVAHTYVKGGKIVYKKLPNGRYQATADMPAC